MPRLSLWILEDNAERREQMLRLCSRWRIETEVFPSALQLIDALEVRHRIPAILSLDHDLNANSPGAIDDCGMLVVDRLCRIEPFASVIVHSSNELAATTMAARLAAANWPTRRIVPFDGTWWIDAHWVSTIQSILESEVAANDAYGWLLTWTDELKTLVGEVDAVGLGILTNRRLIQIFESSPYTDADAMRFPGHEDAVRVRKIDRATLVGGVSFLFNSGKLFGLSRRSTLNKLYPDYLLPMDMVDAILEEVGLEKHEAFKVYS